MTIALRNDITKNEIAVVEGSAGNVLESVNWLRTSTQINEAHPI